MFPLLFEIVGRLMVLGVIQIMWAFALGLLQLVWGLIVTVYAVGRFMLRSAYDCVMFQFIKCFGRIPRRDTTYAWRTAGPGISRNYYYKINHEDIFTLVYAQLEKLELAEFESRMIKLLK